MRQASRTKHAHTYTSASNLALKYAGYLSSTSRTLLSLPRKSDAIASLYGTVSLFKTELSSVATTRSENPISYNVIVLAQVSPYLNCLCNSSNLSINPSPLSVWTKLSISAMAPTTRVPSYPKAFSQISTMCSTL